MIAHGSREFDSTTFQSLVFYDCDDGYYMDEELENMCNESGSWYPPPPTCYPISCGNPGDLLNGKVLG